MKSVVRDGKCYSPSSEHGKVSFLMRTKDGYMVRNVMSENGALISMESGTLTEAKEFPDYPICVNNKFYFPGEVNEVITKPIPAKNKKGD